MLWMMMDVRGERIGLNYHFIYSLSDRIASRAATTDVFEGEISLLVCKVGGDSRDCFAGKGCWRTRCNGSVVGVTDLD